MGFRIDQSKVAATNNTNDTGPVEAQPSGTTEERAAQVAVAGSGFQVVDIRSHPNFGQPSLASTAAARFSATPAFSHDIATRRAHVALDAFARMILTSGDQTPQSKERA